MRIPKDLVSSKLGVLMSDLYEDEEDEETLGLKARHQVDDLGEFDVCFPCDEGRSKDEWRRVVDRFDQDYVTLIDRVLELREEVEVKVQILHSQYFGALDWNSGETKAMDHFRLRHLNYYGDGTVGLWYEGDERFKCFDLNIEIDHEWIADIVKLDG